MAKPKGYTTVQFPESKSYPTVGIPRHIAKLLKLEYPAYALWIPVPKEKDDEGRQLIIFTSVGNRHDLQEEYDRVKSLISD